MTLVDTTLLIDLHRGEGNRWRQAAETWLGDHANEELGIPAIVLGEFSEGFEDPDHPILVGYRTSYRVVEVDALVASIYGGISRSLRARGQAIGANDTWIAAIALSQSCPLLTRNAGHFRRVPDLDVVAYGIEGKGPIGRK